MGFAWPILFGLKACTSLYKQCFGSDVANLCGSLEASYVDIITINVPLFKKLRVRSGQFRGQKSLGPLKMSLEMRAHKVIVPQNKNYVPQFLKQRYINMYIVIPRKRYPDREAL